MTQLTTLALFDDLRDRKSLDLREVGRGGGDRTHDLITRFSGCLFRLLFL